MAMNLAVIEFHEIEDTTNNYTISVNKTQITINKWIGDADSLHQFILECEQLLLTENINSIKTLSNKYGRHTPYIFLDLCEEVFHEPFLQCFNSYGNMFLEQGEFFIARKFCSAIHPSGSKLLRRHFKNLLNIAETNFDHAIALPYLRKAFNQRSLSKVHNVYKTLRFRRFFHLATEKLPTYYIKSYLHFCAEKIVKKGALEISFTGLCKSAFSSMNCYTSLEKDQFDFVMEVVNHWKNEYNRIQMKLGSPLWVIPYRDIQENRLVQLKFTQINPYLKIEIQEYLLFMFNSGEYAKGIARRYHHLMRIVHGVHAISPKCISFLHLTYVEVLQIFDFLQQIKNKNNRNKFSLKTIQASISEARLFFDWLKTKNSEIVKNPFRRFKFHNISSFVKNALYIPDEVIEQLTVAINDCPVYVQRIWLIMMNTGLRASETS